MQKKLTKIVIGGSRDFVDYTFFEFRLNSYLIMKKLEYEDIELVSGGARGVDTLAKMFALNNNILFKEFPVLPNEWKILGKGAGMIRNEKMLRYGDSAVAFWDGKSKGTNHMINLFKKSGKPIEIAFITTDK